MTTNVEKPFSLYASVIHSNLIHSKDENGTQKNIFKNKDNKA